MYRLVNDSEYDSQVEDWKGRTPSILWEKQFDLLNLNISDKNVLDCGCGCGHFVEFFTKRNAQVTGYDREKRCLDEAAKIKPGYERLLQGNIEDINVLDYSFDLIMMRYVLHHIKENFHQSVLNSLFNKLNVGGKIMIETAFQEQFIKHHDHQIFPRLTEILCDVYPKKDELFSLLYYSGFSNISEREIFLEWDNYKTVDDALKRSKLLLDSGKGPTAWLLLSKEERSEFHNTRKEKLKILFPENKVPRYWYSSIIIAEKSNV